MSESILIQQQREMLGAFRQGAARRAQAEPGMVKGHQANADTAQKKLDQVLESAKGLLVTAQAARIRGQEALSEVGLVDLWNRIELVATRAVPAGNATTRLAAASEAGDQALSALQRATDLLRASRQARRTRRHTIVGLSVAGAVVVIVIVVLALQAARVESMYHTATRAVGSGQWQAALDQLHALKSIKPDYKDTSALLLESYYQLALSQMKDEDWQLARATLTDLTGLDNEYKDSGTLLKESYYRPALAAMDAENWSLAEDLLKELNLLDSSYRDAAVLLRESYYQPAFAATQAESWDLAIDYLRLLRRLDFGYKDNGALLLQSQVAVAKGYTQRWLDKRWSVRAQLPDIAGLSEHLSWSQDGRLVAVVRDWRDIIIWDVSSNDERRIKRTSGYSMAIAFSPRDATMAMSVNDADKYIASIDLSDGRIIRRLGDYYTHNLAYAPDGSAVVAASLRHVTVYPGPTSSGSDRQLKCGDCGEGIAFAPSGRYFAAGGSWDLVLYDPADWSEVRRLPWQYSAIGNLSFDSEGRRLAVSATSKIVRVLEVESGRAVREIELPPGEINSISFSYDGRLIAIGHANQVTLWDTMNGSLVQIESGPDAQYDVMFSPDGRYLAVASSKGFKMYEVSD